MEKQQNAQNRRLTKYANKTTTKTEMEKHACRQ